MNFDEVYVRESVCIQVYDVASDADMDCIFLVDKKDMDKALWVLEDARKEALSQPRELYGDILMNGATKAGVEHEAYFMGSPRDRSIHKTPDGQKKEGLSLRDEVCIQVYSSSNEDMDCLFFVDKENENAALQVLGKAWDDFWEQDDVPYGDYLSGEMQNAGIPYDVYYKSSLPTWVKKADPSMQFYQKMQKALKLALTDETLVCHADSIVQELAKSIQTQKTYFNPAFDAWCDNFIQKNSKEDLQQEQAQPAQSQRTMRMKR